MKSVSRLDSPAKLMTGEGSAQSERVNYNESESWPYNFIIVLRFCLQSYPVNVMSLCPMANSDDEPLGGGASCFGKLANGCILDRSRNVSGQVSDTK